MSRMSCGISVAVREFVRGRAGLRELEARQTGLSGGFLVNLGDGLGHGWSPRQESNLYLALRRRLFYPLNYGERIV